MRKRSQRQAAVLAVTAAFLALAFWTLPFSNSDRLKEEFP